MHETQSHAAQRLCLLLVLSAPLFKRETLTSSCMLSLKHNCRNTKGPVQGNVSSNWSGSCPLSQLIARCTFLGFLSTWSLWSCHPPGTIHWVHATDMDFPCIPQILSAWFWLFCHQPIYRLARIKNYVLGTPSPNISLLFKIVWWKFSVKCWRKFPSWKSQAHDNLWNSETACLSHTRHFTDDFGTYCVKNLVFFFHFSNCI